MNIDREVLCTLLKTRVAKYNSQHDRTRHYELEYTPSHDSKDGSTFDVTTSLFIDGVKSAESHAVCTVLATGEMFVKYRDVFPSPHPTSPFHPDNAFYPKLFSGYLIGPLYTVCPVDVKSPFVISVMYHIDDGRVKILNFYEK